MSFFSDGNKLDGGILVCVLSYPSQMPPPPSQEDREKFQQFRSFVMRNSIKDRHNVFQTIMKHIRDVGSSSEYDKLETDTLLNNLNSHDMLDSMKHFMTIEQHDKWCNDWWNRLFSFSWLDCFKSAIDSVLPPP